MFGSMIRSSVPYSNRAPEVDDGARARGRFPNSVGFPEIRGDEFRVCGQWIGKGRDIRQAERPAVLSQQRDNAPRNLAGCPSQQNGARIVSHVSYGSRIIDPVVLRAARSRWARAASRREYL